MGNLEVRDPSNTTWRLILAVDPNKRAATVFRRIGIFIRNIKDAIRLRKKVNLRFQAARMRDSYNDEQAYEMAALFTHFAPEFRGKLTDAMWLQLVEKFKRGGLDHELAEKVAHKDPRIRVDSFRFLQTFGAGEVQRSIDNPKNLAEVENEAVEASESSELKVQTIRLKREAEKWKDSCGVDCCEGGKGQWHRDPHVTVHKHIVS